MKIKTGIEHRVLIRMAFATVDSLALNFPAIIRLTAARGIRDSSSPTFAANPEAPDIQIEVRTSEGNRTSFANTTIRTSLEISNVLCPKKNRPMENRAIGIVVEPSKLRIVTS